MPTGTLMSRYEVDADSFSPEYCTSDQTASRSLL